MNEDAPKDINGSTAGRDTMNFSTALNCVKDGYKLTRKAWWNDKEMFIFLVAGSSFKVNRAPLLGIFPEGTVVDYHSHIDMKHRDGYVTPWTPSQADMLEKDWYIVENVTS